MTNETENKIETVETPVDPNYTHPTTVYRNGYTGALIDISISPRILLSMGYITNDQYEKIITAILPLGATL